MAIRTTITKPGIYFTTFTCYQWFPLIREINGYDMVYNWFDILKSKGNYVNGFVIMPNHLHLLMYYAGGSSLNKIVGNGKRFMAYDIVKRIKQKNDRFYLAQLKLAVEEKDKSRGKLHEIWEDSFDAKECWNESFLLQKLSYIHQNPCHEKWKLATRPELYYHSSAAFYLNGETHNNYVSHYKDFLKFY